MHVQRAVSLKNTIIKEKYHRAWLASAILKEKTDNLKNTKRKTSTRTSNFSNLEVTSINRHICLNLQENRKKKKKKANNYNETYFQGCFHSSKFKTVFSIKY